MTGRRTRIHDLTTVNNEEQKERHQMKTLRIILLTALLSASCEEASLADGKQDKDRGGQTDPTEDIRKEGALAADGNDADTYSLILKSGYNYETPDNSGAHASAPFRHIRQSYDEELGKYVFDFILHIENDDDRGKPDVTDRQRNEIKTDAKSPAGMVAQEGETLRMTWKFRLPEGMKTTKAFSHIHQIKGISDKEGTADVAMPVFTFTVRTLSSGKQQFQVIHVGPSPSSNTYLAKADLSEFLGEWVEATETVRFSDNGAYELVIRRISDGKTLVSVKEDDIATWREAAAGMRPKWGLYRNFGEDGSLKPELRDEVLRFADFLIEKP